MNLGFLAAAAVLLLANAFYVAVEFALIASRRERLEQLATAGRRPAREALSSLDHLSVNLAGAQLGITMASLGLGFVAEPAVAQGLESLLGRVDLSDGLVEGLAVAIAIAVTAFAHLVLGEMVPKTLAIAGPERTLLALALPNRAYVGLFRPVLAALNAMANAGVRLLGVTPRDDLSSAHTAEELAALIATSHQEGVIDPFDHELLTGAIRFVDQPVGTVMVPRDAIEAVGLRTPLDEIERLINERGHSRLPVIGRDLDDVLGFVHVKDLLDGGSTGLAGRRLRRMLVVEEHWTLEDVLLRMQRARLHLALVVDAGGRTVGMATLEDVLEALVGEVYDESDPEEP